MFSAFRTFGALGSQRGVFDVVSLFRAGEQGVWYDPSDTTTLFQDSAGTTPVTASGQPVGLMLDKSKGLVLGSDIFTLKSDSYFNVGDTTNAWIFLAGAKALDFVSVKADSSYLVSPVGGSADRLRIQFEISGSSYAYDATQSHDVFTWSTSRVIRTPANATRMRIYFGAASSTATALSVRELPGNHATQPTAASRPIYRRGDSRGVVNQLLNTETLATQSRTVTAVGHTLSFTGTGSITLSGASTAGPLVGTGVNDRVSLTFTPTAGSLTLTVSGSVTKGQLNLGPTALPYQRNDANLGGVATGASTDLHWLETDGVDDGMVTGNIDFTGTDKVSVFAGLRKLSSTGSLSFLELSAVADSNPGSFFLRAPEGGGENYQALVRGATANTTLTPSSLPAPDSATISLAFNLGTNAQQFRRNGITVATSSGPLGGGNFGNYPLYLFRRGGTSLPFNGWFYGLAITGRLTTAAETVATERYLAAKASVVIP